MKRIVLFLATNLAVIVVLGIVLRLFGLDRAAYSATGLDYTQLLAVLGGRRLHRLDHLAPDQQADGQMVDRRAGHRPAARPDRSRGCSRRCKRLSDRAGIRMPEIAIYDGPPNAFATGAFKNSALVAVSTGLLQTMNKEEVEAVLGHEIAHVANGDMVTMMLIQGVVNTFVVFLARVVGSIVDRTVFRSERGTGPGYYITVIVCEIVFGLLASFIVAWFSRQREFRADRGSAQYLGHAESDDQRVAPARGRHRGGGAARVGAHARHHRQEGPVRADVDASAVRGSGSRRCRRRRRADAATRADARKRKTAGRTGRFRFGVRALTSGATR